jgi:hypothetical protein
MPSAAREVALVFSVGLLAVVGCSLKGGASGSSTPTEQSGANGDPSSKDDGTVTNEPPSQRTAPDASTKSQSPECAAYLECVLDAAPTEYATEAASYGPGGSCWSSGTTAGCTTACSKALAQAATVYYDSPKCNPTAPDPQACGAKSAIESFVPTLGIKSTTCSDCLAAHCCSETAACANGPSTDDTCGAWIDCANSCASSPANPQVCKNGCTDTLPNGYADYDTMTTCMTSNCREKCN